MASSNKKSLRLQSVKHPGNVKVLILAENRTTLKEFYLIKTYMNLIKIDLSYNKLSSFPQGFTFKGFKHLRTLFLHYNKFSALHNLAPITENKSIIYFTLFGNPLQEAKARHLFVNQLPNLMLMDDKIVKMEERHSYLQLQEKETTVLHFPLLPQSKQAELQNTEAHLEIVIKELTFLRRQYLAVNPIIKIQRWWRHKLRMRNRKWKIVNFPTQERLESMMSNLEKSRTELGRLMTQKLQIHKSKEDIVWSALKQNWDFWTSFRNIIQKGTVYLSRQYCQLHQLPFQEIANYKILNDFSSVDRNHRKHLLFFIHYHNQIKVTRKNAAQKEWSKVGKVKLGTLAKKLQTNPEKSSITDAKLTILEQSYSHYVQPLVPFEQLLHRAKKQYITFQQALRSGKTTGPYPFLFQALLSRTQAAITIQKQWRGFKVRQHFDTRLKICQEQAALTIQRWLRNLKFQHRYKFLVQVSRYLTRQKSSSEMVLQMQQIPAIEQYCHLKQVTGLNFVISFQNNPFLLSKSASISYYNSHDRARIVFFAERKPDPAYLNLTFKTETSNLTAEQDQNTFKRTNVLDILFKYAKNVDKLTDKKGTKYVKITYHTPEETLNRKFILALKTYRMAHHQFVTSGPCPQSPNHTTTNLIDTINDNKLVSILQENEMTLKEGSPEHAMKIIQSKRSVASLNSDIQIVDDVVSMKIKFFHGSTDYSGLIILKSPNYNTKKTIRQDTSLNSYRQGYYLGRKKSLSKRYEDDPSGPASKISRNVISLNKLDESAPVSSRKKSLFCPKVLNTDQSHSYLQQSLTPQHSHPRLDKFNRYDKFDKEIYPPLTDNLSKSLHQQQLRQSEEMRHKKTLIEDVKASHHEKAAMLVQRRTEQLKLLRELKAKEQQEHQQKMKKLRSEMDRDRQRRHQKVRKHFKNSTDSFQKDFLKKGMNSIRKDMRDFQKMRSHRQYNNKEYSGQSNLRDHCSHQTTELRNSHKTEIKQFSIKITERDPTILKMSEHSEEHFLLKEDQKQLGDKRRLGSLSKNKSLSSQSQETIGKYLKSQGVEMEAVPNEQRKQLRKKKMVHSVFPEEFYPLKKSNQIGFQLPKITKNGK